MLYQGHEVATHTLMHPEIERCPMVQVADRRYVEVKGGTYVDLMLE